MDLNVSEPAYKYAATYSIPNLESDVFAVAADDLGTVLHANGDVMLGLELGADVAEQKTRLPNGYPYWKKHLSRRCCCSCRGRRTTFLVLRFIYYFSELFPCTLRCYLSLIHISEPTRQAEISYAVFCLKKKKKKK
eukprot:TRINITY_DN3971_c0_g1_i5.p1 TRINITY_DN3971_c0_g1~~TRINITY_DN3971_c0_g1_i5.p1  ORF type:complete len:136 (-),score=2.28 TRINITY_DN3971_c0_g1_i5:3-410(-)